MKSLYAQYIKEREDRETLEYSWGFITYFFVPQEKTCYIADAYVLPEWRRGNFGQTMMHDVEYLAKEAGYKLLLGVMDSRVSTATASQKFMESFGMKKTEKSLDLGSLDIFAKEIA